MSPLMYTTLVLTILGLSAVAIIVAIVFYSRRGRSVAGAGTLQLPDMHGFPKSILWGAVQAPEVEITACSPSTGCEWRQITLPTPTLSHFQALMRDVPDAFRDLGQRLSLIHI